jgi:CRISPR-associated DxTHG motif protein
MEQEPSKRINDVKYIQEALLRMNIDKLSENDSIIFFTTPLSFKMNYKDNGQWNAETKDYTLPNIGLETSLINLNLATAFKNVNIKEGFSEVEIWDVFETISNEIANGDEIILDVTHAFRYLPMLGVVLVDFLRVVKNAKVIGLYYGAFEKLGPSFEVSKMPVSDRNAPVLNLLPLIELQQWVNAVGNFVSHGIAKDIIDLTAPVINPIIRESQGRDIITGNIRAMNSKLGELIPALLTNRGRELMNFKWKELSITLNNLKEAELTVKPLQQIFGIIYDKISPLANSETLWIETSKWCLNHNLVQQGLTQLYEGLLTHLVQTALKELSDEYFEVSSIKARELISSTLTIQYNNIDQEKWKGEANLHPQKVRQLIEANFLQPFSEINHQIAQSRNDINHSGFKSNATNATRLKNQLAGYINALEELLVNTEHRSEHKKNTFLLNLSNHPVAQWTQHQLQSAQSSYSNVEDMPFPQIEPACSAKEMDELIEEYELKVKSLKPSAVHIMGELTFTFRLVSRLMAAGIPCIASTSVRSVTMQDNIKTSDFQFVQFRHY